jgi:hypothetical protein
MLTLTGLDEVKSHVGKELGVSDWLEVTQETINRFAEVTGTTSGFTLMSSGPSSRRLGARSPTATTSWGSRGCPSRGG